MTAIDENLTRDIGVLATEDDGRARMQDGFMHGLCRALDPGEFFAEVHDAQLHTRTRCFDCPVRLECLADALDNRVNWGIWGGTTERERRAILRRAPDVADWYPIIREIQDQQDDHRRSARRKLAELWRNKQSRENSSLES